MDRRTVLLIVILSVLCFNLSDASLCTPNSKFKLDCNSCNCDSSGKQYTCSNNNCPPKNYDEKFYNTETKDGHKLLVPKNNDQFEFEDDDFVLNSKSRQTRVPEGYPYIDDEMPSGVIQDVDNSKTLDVEVMERDPKSIKTEDSEDESDENDDDEDAESNDVNYNRWARFLPRDKPSYPE